MPKGRIRTEIELSIERVWVVVLLSFLPIISLQSQETWKIKGVIKGENGNTLPQGLVVAQKDSSNNYIDFKSSNEDGSFALTIPNEYSTVLFTARYLGYEVYKTKIIKESNIFLDVRMTPQNSELMEVVIKEDRPPITQNSDTTVYKTAEFSDSSEFNVEDILKKLPGVEVSSEGSIKVNGKEIQTVLVEGTNLFGGKYTIGTKNIRSDYIDRVEVIDKFQDNPVLKKVNYSDQIVLNLLLKEDKKNIISGTAEVGLGFGEVIKYTGHINLFSISEKNKVILLTDNGNTGDQYDLDELDATYGRYNEQDIASFDNQRFQILEPPTIFNPGVPPSFIDNSHSAFATLRSDLTISSRWNLQINTLFSRKTDHQKRTLTEQFWRDENNYFLETEEDLNFASKLLNIEAKIKHVSKNNKVSFISFGKIQGKSSSTNNTILSYQGRNTRTLNQGFDIQNTDWQASNQFSFQFLQNSVGQIEFKGFQHQTPSLLLANNPDFVFRYSDSLIQQDIDFSRRELQVNARWLWSKGPWIIKVQPSFSNRKTDRIGDLLSQKNLEKIQDFSEKFISNKVQVTSQINFNLSSLDNFSALAILGDEKFSSSSNVLNKSKYSFFGLSFNWDHDWSSKLKSRLGYSQFNNPPDYLRFFEKPIIVNQFQIRRYGLRDRPESGNILTLNLSKRIDATMRSWYINSSLTFNQSYWDNAVQFNRSIIEIGPFFSGENNRLSITANYTQFFPKIRTKIDIRPSFSKIKNNLQIEGETPTYSFSNTRIYLRISNVSFRDFQIIAEQRLTKSAINDNTNRQFSLVFRGDYTLAYRPENWRFSITYNMNRIRQRLFDATNFHTAYLKVSRQIQIGRKEMTVKLRVNNLFFSENFNRILSGDFLISNRSVEAVPAFFIFKVDYGF